MQEALRTRSEQVVHISYEWKGGGVACVAASVPMSFVRLQVSFFALIRVFHDTRQRSVILRVYIGLCAPWLRLIIMLPIKP